MARPRKVQENIPVQEKVETCTVSDYGMVKLKDKNIKELVVYLPYGYVEFKNGTAFVSQKAKATLKDMGVI